MNQNETVSSLQEENRCRFQKVVFFLYKYQKPNRRKQFSRYWKEILRDISLSARCWYVDWRYSRYLHYKRIVLYFIPWRTLLKRSLEQSDAQQVAANAHPTGHKHLPPSTTLPFHLMTITAWPQPFCTHTERIISSNNVLSACSALTSINRVKSLKLLYYVVWVILHLRLG